VKEKKQSPLHSSNSSLDFKMAGQNLLPAFPAANSPQRLQVTGRAKVALKPGRSLMDWIRLGRSSQDLNGFNGKTMDISVEELAKHTKQEDAWIAIRGNTNVLPCSIDDFNLNEKRPKDVSMNPSKLVSATGVKLVYPDEVCAEIANKFYQNM